VVAHVGPAAFFKWEFDHAKSPPKPPPLASLAPSLADRGPWAVKWLDSTPSRTLKVEQALPAAALNLDCSAPALVGELFPVIMTVHAKDASITTSFLRVSLEPSAARAPPTQPSLFCFIVLPSASFRRLRHRHRPERHANR
jgi:hypothetical protein